MNVYGCFDKQQNTVSRVSSRDTPVKYVRMQHKIEIIFNQQVMSHILV